MNWTQVDIYTATPAIDLLSVRLQDLGIRGCMVQDAEDFQEFLEQKDGKWDYLEDGLMELASCETCVTVYLPEDAQGAETLAALRAMLAQMKSEDTEGQYGRLEAVCSGIREEDWANNWKQYFKPFPVGKKLYIKPSWEEPTAAAEGRTILEIDPASSFGTGQHHTTRLCLELMENEIVPDSTRLLDLGNKIMIGKGKRDATVKEAVVRNGAVYLAALGGAGALMAKSVETLEVIAWPDLGCEAVRRLTVRDMPLTVILDAHGSDLYQSGPAAYLESEN